MFQLIVAVIAIFLVAVMVIAGIYFGGSAHTEAAIRAQYAGNMNVAAQIEGALQLYRNDHAGNPPATYNGVENSNGTLLQFLTDQTYLKDKPDGDWKVSDTAIYKPFASNAQDISVCVAMNRVAGMNVAGATDLAGAVYGNGCPPCNGAEGTPERALAEKYKSWPGCQFLTGG